RYDDIGEVFGRARPATGFSADLKVLAGLAAGRDAPEEVQSIYAPCIGDPDLDERVRDLRASGRIVIRELPGQTGDAVDMGCGYILEKQQGEWMVSPLQVTSTGR
ncbi:MAG: ATP phosphoribosyltransferase regulatory subunit, partial [Pseudomonadota bacterium]